MLGKLGKLWTPAGRFRFYLIALAVAPMLIFYGIRSETEVGLWVGLLGALMGAGGNGLAVGHVYPRATPDVAPADDPPTIVLPPVGPAVIPTSATAPDVDLRPPAQPWPPGAQW